MGMPSLTPLPVDGNPAKIKWLLMVSSGNQDAATGMQYFVGDFDGKTFKNDYPADNKLFVDYGPTFYAAIPYNHLPGNRQTMLGWLMPFKTETWPWRGQMSIARDLLLKQTDGGVKLYQQPSAVLYTALDKLPAAKKMVKQSLTVDNKAVPLHTSRQFNGNANWIEAEFTVGAAEETGFKLAQKNGSGTVVGYNTQRNELYVSQEENGQLTGPLQKLTVQPVDGKIKLQVLLDKSSLEVFVNGGEYVLTTLIFPDKDATGLAVYAKGKAQVNTLKVWDLMP